jgi:hypothetical protein
VVALWEPILDALATPQPTTTGSDAAGAAGTDPATTAGADAAEAGDGASDAADADEDAGAAGGAANSGGAGVGVPDRRSAAQRRHDAMAEVARRLLRSDTLPAAGGVPVTVLAVTTMSELQAGVGTATTGHGEHLSIAKLLEMAADAHVIPVVCADTGGVLAYGRGRRLASKAQRLALAARDRGCSFPGCTRPPAWTEVHHVTAWIHGGTTDLDHMCLLCRYHHRHHAQHGWEAVMRDGVPYWRPPTWLNPDRTPIRNTAHHPPDIDFRQPAA